MTIGLVTDLWHSHEAVEPGRDWLMDLVPGRRYVCAKCKRDGIDQELYVLNVRASNSMASKGGYGGKVGNAVCPRCTPLSETHKFQYPVRFEPPPKGDGWIRGGDASIASLSIHELKELAALQFIDSLVIVGGKLSGHIFYRFDEPPTPESLERMRTAIRLMRDTHYKDEGEAK